MYRNFLARISPKALNGVLNKPFIDRTKVSVEQASQAAEIVGFGVILSEAKNLSSI
jgi:hypothetical protein